MSVSLLLPPLAFWLSRGHRQVSQEDQALQVCLADRVDLPEDQVVPEAQEMPMDLMARVLKPP